MNIGLIINHSKEKALEIAEKVIKILSENNVDVYITSELEQFKKIANLVDDAALYTKSDIIVVIGGDGTIIHSAKKAAKYSKSVLGINAGRVGYLAGLEGKDIKSITKLLKSEYITEKRIMLKATLKSGASYYALNDLVVSKGGLSRMIDIKAEVENHILTYRADGLIAATPTGSTAYSLSAGGPVIDPSLESIVLTPISPQSLYARPIILNSNDVIYISANAPEDSAVYLTVDGEEAVKLSNEEVITINKAENIFVNIIKLDNSNFLSGMVEKFNLLQN